LVGLRASAGGHEAAAVGLHVGVVEVGVSLRAKRGYVLAMVWTGEALVVADHVADGDVVMAT
jgi:hypothetical protein